MPDRRTGLVRFTSDRSRLREYGLALLAVAALVGLIGLLGHSARVDEPTDFDHTIHAWVVDSRQAWPWLTRLMLWVTWIGDPPFATAATLVVMFGLHSLHRRSIAGIRRSEVYVWLGAILGAWYLGRALKSLFRRERPPAINRLVLETAYSFPSGHSVFAGAFYTLLAILLARGIPSSRPWSRRAAVALCLLAAVSIALSRVWLGVHYPTDVLAGLLIGSSTAAGIWSLRLGWGHTPGRDAGEPSSSEDSRRNDDPPGVDQPA